LVTATTVTINNNDNLQFVRLCALTTTTAVTLSANPKLQCSAAKAVFGAVVTYSGDGTTCVSGTAAVDAAAWRCSDTTVNGVVIKATPAPPTQLTVLVGEGFIDVSWVAPLFAGDATNNYNITSYNVRSVPAQSSTTLVLASASTPLKVQMEGLSLGEKYTFIVTAVSSGALTSGDSLQSPAAKVSNTGAVYAPKMRSLVLGSPLTIFPEITGVAPFAFEMKSYPDTRTAILWNEWTVGAYTGVLAGVLPYLHPGQSALASTLGGSPSSQQIFAVTVQSSPNTVGGELPAPVTAYIGLEVISVLDAQRTYAHTRQFDVVVVGGNAAFNAAEFGNALLSE
jgi:hypothetical protein